MPGFEGRLGFRRLRVEALHKGVGGWGRALLTMNYGEHALVQGYFLGSQSSFGDVDLAIVGSVLACTVELV